MSEVHLPPIPQSQMYIDEVMSLEWQGFFRDLLTRIGGIDHPNMDELAVDVTGDIAAAILVHSNDTTNIHGIGDTDDLITSVDNSKLTAPDGDPDPALSIDNDGKASLIYGVGINEFSVDGALTGNSDDAVPTEKAIKTYVDAIDSVLGKDWDQNGFEDKADSEIIWTDSSPDYTLSIQPTGISSDYFTFWVAGVKYTSEGDTVKIDDTKEGIHLVYYDGSTLTALANPTTSDIISIIENMALVSIVYWDVSAATAIYVGEERHGKSMSPTTHTYLHFTEGLRYISGLGLNTLDVDGTGNDNTNAQFGVDAGEVSDEDLLIAISAVASGTGLPIYHMLGAAADWQKDVNAGYSVRTYDGTSATRLAWNEYTGGAWQLTEVANLRFVLYHVFATTEKDKPMIAIMGQNTYTTLNSARTGSLTEIRSLVLDDVSFPEIKPIATIIFQTDTGYGNVVKGRIRSTDDGDDYIDWRSETVSRVELSTSDHNALSGLQGGTTNEYYHFTATQHPLIASLVDNSIVNTLHRHSELVASDGSPDPALSIDADGIITTNGSALRINTLGSGNRYAYIDLVGDDTYTTYGLRVVRNGLGANTSSYIQHRGTGSFSIRTEDAAAILFITGGNLRLTIAADGKVSLISGTGINEFSTDGTLAGNSDDAVPTEKAVKTYADGVIVSSPNILINQDFSIWQENTTFTNPANNVYTADGYKIEKQAGGGTDPTINVKKNTADMETGFEQCCELEITNVGVAGATRSYLIVNKTEDYKKYAGKTLTLAFRVKASTNITLPNGRLLIYDGVGAQNVPVTSITTDWVTYSVSLTINNNPTQLISRFDLISGANEVISATGSIYIQWMKLELGSVATPLIPRKTGEELGLCQRYYQKSYLQTVFPGTNTTVGARHFGLSGVENSIHAIRLPVMLPVNMKAAPTVTLYDIVGASGKVTMQSGSGIAGTVYNAAESGFNVGGSDAAGINPKLQFHYTAISRV